MPSTIWAHLMAWSPKIYKSLCILVDCYFFGYSILPLVLQNLSSRSGSLFLRCLYTWKINPNFFQNFSSLISLFFLVSWLICDVRGQPKQHCCYKPEKKGKGPVATTLMKKREQILKMMVNADDWWWLLTILDDCWLLLNQTNDKSIGCLIVVWWLQRVSQSTTATQGKQRKSNCDIHCGW